MGDNAVAKQLKKAWKKDGEGLSLRQFAKKLLSSGEGWVQKWYDNKDGACNMERAEKNVMRANQERQASKLARKKSKGSGGKAAA